MLQACPISETSCHFLEHPDLQTFNTAGMNMRLLANTIKDGFIKALKTTATLMKVVLPVYAIVVLLKYSPVMPFLENFFQPSMRIFNLPGEAVVPLITGVFTDEYGTIAATRQFDFDTLQITTIAMICLVFHSIPVEYALSRKIG